MLISTVFVLGSFLTWLCIVCTRVVNSELSLWLLIMSTAVVKLWSFETKDYCTKSGREIFILTFDKFEKTVELPENVLHVSKSFAV